jgi:hypothetical protein
MNVFMGTLLLVVVSVSLAALVPLAKFRKAKRDSREMKRHLQSIAQSEG